MAHAPLTPQASRAELTAAERDWIRRQGLTARALEVERRRVRAGLAAGGDDLARVRAELRRGPRRFSR